MKIRSHPARNAIPVFLFLLSAACGGSPPKDGAGPPEPVPASNHFLGTRPVYAQLVNERDGSWVFKTVTGSDSSPETGYLVRLNDLSPAFDIRVAECVPQVYPASHRCNPGHPFRDEDARVLDRIINGSIAVGTAGKVTDISQTYETRFDESAFNRAVDEALLNTGLDNDRRRLITLVEAYDTKLREARAELAEMTKQLSASRQNVDRVELDVDPRISGLTEYYEGDIDFVQLVKLTAAGESDVPAVTLERRDILPCDARECAARAEAALATLKQDVRQHKDRLAASMRPDSTIYNVRCEDAVHGGYLLVAECPAELVVSGNEPATLPMKVTILSRDFDNLYPVFDLADDHLSVDIEEKSVIFSNTTNEYITLTAQTVYYNSTVHTTSLPIDMPPGISVTRDMNEFVSRSIDIESSYRQMTPDKAAGASFRFGFAVRYRIASRPEELTLHDLRTFNVGCVIRNQIRPGSCRSESLADTRRQRSSTGTEADPRGPM